MAKKNADFKFRVVAIEDFGFTIDEFINVEEENVYVGYRLDLFFNIEDSWLGLIINVFFEAEKPEEKSIDIERNAFMSGKVATRFEIENLENYMNDNSLLNFPKDKFEKIFEIALTHARAILAKNSAGSSYSNYIIPIVNVKEILPGLIDYSNILNK